MRFTITLLLTVAGMLAQLRGPGGKLPRGLYKSDPTHLVCNQCSLEQLVREAFGVRDFQLSGPKFLNEQLVDVKVDIPAGATEEQYQLVLRNLLETRLGLVTHREKREVPAVELVVSEGGSLLKAAGGELAPPVHRDPFGLIPATVDSGHTPEGQRRPTSVFQLESGVARFQGTETLATLARVLSNQLKQPVTDSTGLAGKYPFVLTWTADPGIAGTGGSTLQAALRYQLGLKLVPSAQAVEVVVVDHIEKHPRKR